MDPTSRTERVTTLPNSNQILVDYDGGTNPIYVGYGGKGIATSDDDWFIQKITWVSNNPTVIKSANEVVWDDRASLGYT